MAEYRYYNQRNYPHIPYPSPTLKSATVKSGGCGVCCGAMIVANLKQREVDMVRFTQYVLDQGARISGGTDMKRLSAAICRDYGLTVRQSNGAAELVKHLAAGHMAIAIANVSGNRQGYTGVFSDSGHYIVIAGIKGDLLSVLDPAMYPGKFDLPGRKGKVSVKGAVCVCQKAVLEQDVHGRNPVFYLFS